jgi:tetratricopeptide (TPR) repeat protein
LLELIEKGLNLQRAGKLKKAQAAMKRALDLAGATGEESVKNVVLVKLATIIGDQGKLKQSQKLLTQAATSTVVHGPTGLLAEIAYERACILKQQGRKQNAAGAFKEAIKSARTYDVPHMECLSFQELADMELLVAHFPGGINALQDADAADAARTMITQVKDYVERAEEAADRAGYSEQEAAQHSLLRAKIALVEGHRQLARSLAIKARNLFISDGDWRSTTAENTLALLDGIDTTYE